MHTYNNVFIAAYEGEETKSTNTNGDNSTNSNTSTQTPKTFTQEELNKIVAKERKAVADKLSKLGELSSLTEAQAKELAELRSSVQTQEEARAEELSSWKKKYETETATLKNEGETWKKRFSDSTIKKELLTAFSPVAHDPEQFIELFSSKAELAEVKVDGKLTGEFEVRIPHTLEIEGKKVTKKLTPSELQKVLYDQPKYANLFKGKGTGGTGGGNSGSGAGLSNEEYIAQRLAGKIQLK